MPAAFLTTISCGLGDPVAYREEKSGALIHDEVPVPGRESFIGNAGSRSLPFHTENAFHPQSPDYVLLQCLRPDHERTAALRVGGIRRALPLLTDKEHRSAVHGRTAFEPRYDQSDRWLQRTYALTDIRRSRDLRSFDGYVLGSSGPMTSTSPPGVIGPPVLMVEPGR